MTIILLDLNYRKLYRNFFLFKRLICNLYYLVQLMHYYNYNLIHIAALFLMYMMFIPVQLFTDFTHQYSLIYNRCNIPYTHLYTNHYLLCLKRIVFYIYFCNYLIHIMIKHCLLFAILLLFYKLVLFLHYLLRFSYFRLYLYDLNLSFFH